MLTSQSIFLPTTTQPLSAPLSLLGRPKPLQLALLGFHH